MPKMIADCHLQRGMIFSQREDANRRYIVTKHRNRGPAPFVHYMPVGMQNVRRYPMSLWLSKYRIRLMYVYD